jgi:hypothetical protein
MYGIGIFISCHNIQPRLRHKNPAHTSYYLDIILPFTPKSHKRNFSLRYSHILTSKMSPFWCNLTTINYSALQYSAVQYSAVQYSRVQYSAVQYSTVQCSTAQYSRVQYSAVQ